MVLWCKVCAAFVGLRPPISNWTVDREGLCPTCVAKEPAIAKDVEKVIEKEQGSASDERRLIPA